TNPQSLRPLINLWKTLHARKYDAVLLLHHLTLFFGRLKHQVLMRASGAKWRVGLDNGHGCFLNVRVPDKGFGAKHEAEYSMSIAEAVGATVHNKHLTVPLNDADREHARQLVFQDTIKDTIPHPIIAMHPGSGGYSLARRWAPERFAQLADTL